LILVAKQLAKQQPKLVSILSPVPTMLIVPVLLPHKKPTVKLTSCVKIALLIMTPRLRHVVLVRMVERRAANPTVTKLPVSV